MIGFDNLKAQYSQEEDEENPYDFEISFSSKEKRSKSGSKSGKSGRSGSNEKKRNRRRRKAKEALQLDSFATSSNISALDKAKHFLQKYSSQAKPNGPSKWEMQDSQDSASSYSENTSQGETTPINRYKKLNEGSGKPTSNSSSDFGHEQIQRGDEGFAEGNCNTAAVLSEEEDSASRKSDTVSDVFNAWADSPQEKISVEFNEESREVIDIEDEVDSDVASYNDDVAFQKALEKAEREEEERRREAMASIASTGIFSQSDAILNGDRDVDGSQKLSEITSRHDDDLSARDESLETESHGISPVQSVEEVDERASLEADLPRSEESVVQQMSSLDAYSTDAFDAESEGDLVSEVSRAGLEESAKSRIQTVAIASSINSSAPRRLLASRSKADASTQCYALKDSAVQANLVISNTGLVYEVPQDGSAISNPFPGQFPFAATSSSLSPTILNSNYIGVASQKQSLAGLGRSVGDVRDLKGLDSLPGFQIPREVEQFTSVQATLTAANSLFLRNLELIKTQLSACKFQHRWSK